MSTKITQPLVTPPRTLEQARADACEVLEVLAQNKVTFMAAVDYVEAQIEAYEDTPAQAPYLTIWHVLDAMTQEDLNILRSATRFQVTKTKSTSTTTGTSTGTSQWRGASEADIEEEQWRTGWLYD